ARFGPFVAEAVHEQRGISHWRLVELKARRHRSALRFLAPDRTARLTLIPEIDLLTSADERFPGQRRQAFCATGKRRAGCRRSLYGRRWIGPLLDYDAHP